MSERSRIINAPCPMPHAQCPMPNSHLIMIANFAVMRCGKCI
ncbi:MAG: hypothetical protein V7K98_18320 [Nostoc sp.]